MKNPPFISITDFTTPQQVEMMLNVLPDDFTHMLGIGVMMSYKTLRGIPSKWNNAFPKNKDVERIFMDLPKVFNVLHYADYNDDSSSEDFVAAIYQGGRWIDAVQYDMIWPSVEDIRSARHDQGISVQHYLAKVIIQVGTNALEEVNNNPKRVVDRLIAYREAKCLDYVLLDKSMGQGKPMDPHTLLPYIYEIKKQFSDVGVIVAGGLGPNTINLVEPIIKEFPDISIDAQSKLRPSGSALEPIDWNMAKNYLEQACELFYKHRE